VEGVDGFCKEGEGGTTIIGRSFTAEERVIRILRAGGQEARVTG